MAAAPFCRVLREGDERAVNQAFATASGATRSLDEWSWLYPAEEGGRTIVVAEAGGEIVAHCGGAPLRLAVDDGEWTGVRLADVFGLSKSPDSSPANLVNLVAGSFVRTLESREGCQFLMGFSDRHDDDQVALPRCLGERESLRFFAYTRERPPLSPPRRLLYRAEAARDWEPRLDELWAGVRPYYPVAIVRDADRALRRFAGHPTVHFQRFLVFPRFSAQAVGFACFRCNDGICRWVDLVWDHRHPGALDLLAHLSARLARQFDCAGEELRMAGDDGTRKRLETLGFCRVEDPTRLSVVLRSTDPAFEGAALPSRMYLTLADTEMV